jgi:pilus assembly protein Flp/PilA
MHMLCRRTANNPEALFPGFYEILSRQAVFRDSSPTKRPGHDGCAAWRVMRTANVAEEHHGPLERRVRRRMVVGRSKRELPLLMKEGGARPGVGGRSNEPQLGPGRRRAARSVDGGLREECAVRRCIQFYRDEDATTAVEYAVMLAMIIMACIGTVSLFGGQTGSLWGNSKTKMEAAGFGASS